MIPAMSGPGLSGRRAQAARNDERILRSARAVFIADPGAPITAVAKHAGVGISALYSRYGSKEELLRTLCRDGLQVFVDISDAALADERDPWTAFSEWMERLVDADTSSLTLALAGSFTPTPDMFELAQRANEQTLEMFARVKTLMRPGVGPHDPSLIFEMVAALRVGDEARTKELRRRFLIALLDGLRANDRGRLAGSGPTWDELSSRWG